MAKYLSIFALNLKDIINKLLLSFFYDKKKDNNKIIWVDIGPELYNRYLLNLIKFFTIEGYQVYLKFKVSSFLIDNRWARLIFKEDNVKISFSSPNRSIFGFSNKRTVRRGQKYLSANYFENLNCLGTTSDSDYRIPMAMHPYMYIHQYWNINYQHSRKRSVFFAGNFDERIYSKFTEENKFSMLDRLTIYKRLKNFEFAVFPETYYDFVSDKKEKQVVVVNRINFDVPMEKLREVISSFSFFLACPGMVMPFSHNLIEAMSVGTIPIIHQNYASLFNPVFQHMYNAIIFDNADLEKRIEEALNLSDNAIKEIADNAQKYYSQYLCPKAVVDHILNTKGDIIYLLNGINSVKLIK